MWKLLIITLVGGIILWYLYSRNLSKNNEIESLKEGVNKNVWRLIDINIFLLDMLPKEKTIEMLKLSNAFNFIKNEIRNIRNRTDKTYSELIFDICLEIEEFKEKYNDKYQDRLDKQDDD